MKGMIDFIGNQQPLVDFNLLFIERGAIIFILEMQSHYAITLYRRQLLQRICFKEN